MIEKCFFNHKLNILTKLILQIPMVLTKKIFKKNVLITFFQELGVGNIERCKGFAEHLMTLVIKQYTDMGRLSEVIAKIR